MTTDSQTPQVRTLLLTDMVDSTGLVERLGDSAAAGLFRAHDRMVLELQQRWRGRLIDRSDGLLLIFERPIDGLGFALDYVRGLRELSRERDLKPALQARAGLHVGEVLVWENSVESVRVGAKSMEVEGLAKPLAGRLMALARPGQILLSATAEPLAHRAARELGERGELLAWKSYGRWRFKGLPEAQEVFEVGEPGLAPLRMPAHTPKAWRDLPLWRRPAALAAEALLLAVVVTGGWFLSRPQPAIAFAERDWVVVGDVRNLTGDARYDDTLGTALRISLEQSRYVNVLPDARVQDTLERMGRDPETRVDRLVGTEVAQRSGARALLLPTVSESGGLVRVSIEVVDPATETTVFTESAASRGADSAVKSVGQAGEALRRVFGEEMASIKASSAPLENVTTDKLEALRAFTLGQKAYAIEDLDAAEQQFKQALAIDPKFAMARIGLARVAHGKKDVVTSQQQMTLAIADVGRLTDRERLYAIAQMSLIRWDKDFIEKWIALSKLYPDLHVAAFNVANGMRYGNRYMEMRQYSDRAAAMQAVTRPAALAFRGIAEAGLGRLVAAERDFGQAKSLGFQGMFVEFALIKAAAFRFDEAAAMLGQSRDGPAYAATEKSMAELTIMADARRWDEAGRLARTLIASVPEPVLPFDWAARATALAVLRQVASRVELDREAKRLLDHAEQAMPNGIGRARESIANAALYAGYVAASNGDIALAKRALNVARPAIDRSPQPVLANFSAIVRARIDMQSGNAKAALQELDRFSKPWALSLTRVEAINARRALGQDVASDIKALAKQGWRSRAYAEWAAERPPVIESVGIR